MIHHY